MTSAVLSEAALLWSVYVLSVAAVSLQRIRSNVVRLPRLWLNLFCLSLYLLFLVFSPLSCHDITSHHSVFLLHNAGLLTFHNS